MFIKKFQNLVYYFLLLIRCRLLFFITSKIFKIFVILPFRRERERERERFLKFYHFF